MTVLTVTYWSAHRDVRWRGCQRSKIKVRVGREHATNVDIMDHGDSACDLIDREGLKCHSPVLELNISPEVVLFESCLESSLTAHRMPKDTLLTPFRDVKCLVMKQRRMNLAGRPAVFCYSVYVQYGFTSTTSMTTLKMDYFELGPASEPSSAPSPSLFTSFSPASGPFSVSSFVFGSSLTSSFFPVLPTPSLGFTGFTGFNGLAGLPSEPSSEPVGRF